MLVLCVCVLCFSLLSCFCIFFLVFGGVVVSLFVIWGVVLFLLPYRVFWSLFLLLFLFSLFCLVSGMAGVAPNRVWPAFQRLGASRVQSLGSEV